MKQKEVETLQRIRDALSDYGTAMAYGITQADIDLLDDIATRANLFEIAREQASYATRYRFGECAETNATACRIIANMETN